MNACQLLALVELVPSEATNIAIWMGRVYFDAPLSWGPSPGSVITPALSQQGARKRRHRWQFTVPRA